MRRGLTFVEVLIVVVIVALLIALTFPVIGSVRKSAKESPCISNLRQIGMAWSMYIDNHDGKWPTLVDDIVAGNREIAKCPLDRVDGANKDATERLKTKISYFYINLNPEFRSDIGRADPNHGIAYCVLHGRFAEDLPFRDAVNDTDGKVLRLLVDGSVHTAHVDHVCSEPTDRGFIQGRPEWMLLTEARPCPDKWCGGLTKPCTRG